MIENVVIGIDLGTTHCCVSIWRNNSSEIIPNDLGERITPSYILYSENETIIGKYAKEMLSNNPKNTIYNIKRLIGRKYDDIYIKENKKKLTYDIVSINNKPHIKIVRNNYTEQLTPEEISATILRKLKKIAEDYLGTSVKNAVITVPAYFNDAQRNATKDAGTIAGLNVLRIINEPTAAAIAYGLNKDKNKELNILVFDLGGGTLDVSILNLCDGVFEVKSTSGNTYLGGEDFDNIIINHCINENVNMEIKDLKLPCEEAKKKLSNMNSCIINVNDKKIEFSRILFEQKSKELIKKCLEPIDEALEIANLKISDIDEIILVGGSTRIPIIQKKLKEKFNKNLCKSINPDEAVAIGAAIQGELIVNKNNNLDIVLVSTVPITLGVETEGKIMTTMIERGSKIPIEVSNVFTPASHEQTSVCIRVFEGQRQLTKDCNFLGEFILQNIRKHNEIVQIEIKYSVNVNGILDVQAIEKSSGISNKISIKHNKNNLSKEEIDELVDKANKMEEHDNNIIKKINKKSEYTSSIYNIYLEDFKKELTEEGYNKLKSLLEENKKWLIENNDESFEKYDEKLKQFGDDIEPILNMSKIHNYVEENVSESSINE